MNKITTPEMEAALASWFNYRVNLIVPNVYWGFSDDMHECDLMIVSKAGYVTEVEIKISRADLRADAKKSHGHRNQRIKYLYFAVPEKLEAAALEFAPERAGIITVATGDLKITYYEGCKYIWPRRCKRIRAPSAIRKVAKMSDPDRYKVARLGALRIWDLKTKIIALKKSPLRGLKHGPDGPV